MPSSAFEGILKVNVRVSWQFFSHTQVYLMDIQLCAKDRSHRLLHLCSRGVQSAINGGPGAKGLWLYNTWIILPIQKQMADSVDSFSFFPHPVPGGHRTRDQTPASSGYVRKPNVKICEAIFAPHIPQNKFCAVLRPYSESSFSLADHRSRLVRESFETFGWWYTQLY